MKQKISEFLFELSQTYPIRGGNPDVVLEDTRTYIVGYLYNKDIDFVQAKKLIFDNYDSKTFPTPKVILSYLNQCEIKKYEHCEDEGGLVVITLPNGAIYSFEITGFGKPIEDIKQQAIAKYGNVQIKTYPKGSVLIGKQVVLP